MKTIMMTLCALLANTAFADIVTWVGPSIGDWGEPDNWEDSFNVNRVPDQFDRAVVDDAQVVINDTEHFIVDTINVMENATLRIDCDASLTLENDNDNLCAECEIPDPTDHSRIDGSVILFRGAILVVQSKGIYTTDHKFTGTGHIIGTSTPVNEIRIQPGKRMWNLLRNGTESGIRNHLTITRDGQTGTAGLLNDGDIVCSDPGTLSIDSSIDLEDTANGIYMVDDKDAVVALNTAALELEGDFVQTG